MRPPAILSQAACKGADTELFFPVSTSFRAYSAAAQYCLRCPVWRECLQYALDENIGDGMWGGSTPEHRTEIKAGKVDAAKFEPGHCDKGGTEAGYERERRLGVPNCERCSAEVAALSAQRKSRRKVAV